MRNADPRWLAMGCPSTTVALVVWSRPWDVVLLAVVRPIADRTERLDVAGVRERLGEFYRLLEEITDTGHALGRTLVYSYVGWALFAAALHEVYAR